MPYKDPEKNRECKRLWYYRNREKEIKRSQKRREELTAWFKNLKKKYKCVSCGENHPACVEFHHKYSNEKESIISDMPNQGYSREKIKNEIKKCIPLCANCHRKIHYETKT